MAHTYTRRKLLATAGVAVAIGGVANNIHAAERQKSNRVRIIGIACSPRKGKTTAAAMKVCLDAAAQVDPTIETELIELADMKIDGSLAAGLEPPPGQKDDFAELIPRLSDPKVAGIIIGTPVYFCNMTSLCKAFLDRWIVFRKNFALSGKVAAVLAVGGARNGGQEITIHSVQAALLCQEMIIVGDPRPGARIGAALWNDGSDDITKDESGMTAARNLGRRVAEVALKIAAAT